MMARNNLSLVHTSDGDGSTKSHYTNPVKRRQNRRKQTLPFSPVPSPFYRVCMEFRASISVSASVPVASVNQALAINDYNHGEHVLQGPIVESVFALTQAAVGFTSLKIDLVCHLGLT